MAKIRPVILCGGAGSRLWPLSTPEKPKPFHKFSQSRTLFQQALLRTRHAVFSAPPIVVARHDHAALVQTQAREIDLAIDLILEPVGRDSCAAALAGVLQASHASDLVAIMAADHHIPDATAFAEGFGAASGLAEAGYLVTFGVRPGFATADYGYVLQDEDEVRFVEKPPMAEAGRLIALGARWNSGNFLGRAAIWREAAARHAPLTLQAVERALAGAIGGQLTDSFADAPQQSLDTAIFEKSDRVAMVPVDYAWSDIGTWDEVARLSGTDGAFVLTNHVEVLAPGLDDLIIVSDGKRLLVTKRGQSQALKQLLREAVKA